MVFQDLNDCVSLQQCPGKCTAESKIIVLTWRTPNSTSRSSNKTELSACEVESFLSAKFTGNLRRSCTTKD